MADSGTQTPEALRRRYALAQAMMAGQKRPIQHWTQGLEDLANAGIGGYQFAKAEASDRERLANDSAALAAITGGAGPDRGNIAGTSGSADVARALGLNWPGMGPQPAVQPSAPAAAPVGNAGASQMGKLPAMGSRVYDQSEFNPLDAAVATPKELAAGVPAPPQYASLIGKAAVDNDLPPQLLAAQLKQESEFNPNAVGQAGEQGISQFMPATAKEVGLQNPFDPAQSIPAGARYLRQNIDRFGGSVPLGLAAYNAGPGRVERSGGDISRLPASTQGYVSNITGASQSPVAAALSQPAQGGILSGATPQQRAAIAAGMNASEGSPARAIAMSLMQTLAKPRDQWVEERGQDGSFYQRNTLTGERKVIEKSDVLPEAAVVQKERLAKAGATKVTTNIDKGESEFDKASAKHQAERFNDLATDGAQAKQMVSDVQTLTQLGNQIGTGKGAEFKAAVGPYAQALGVKVEGLSDIQAFEALVNRVAPNLRVKGSGAQSDYELKNFLKSIPSLGNTPEGNALVGQTLEGLAQNKMKAAEIGSMALNKEITRAEADKRLRELPDPMEEWRKATKAAGSTKPNVDALKKKYNLQ